MGGVKVNVQPLLDFIAKHESNGDYNIVWGGIKAKDRPKKPLTQMTVGEVLAWQDSIDAAYQSEAAGKYQIMEDTLRGLYAEAGMTLQSMFDKAGQDHLGTALLRRRGLDRFVGGAMTAEQFANNLAREWASLPCVSGPKKGRSYYDGDGLNKAGVDVTPFMTAVRAVKSAAGPSYPPSAPKPIPLPPVAAQGWLAAFIAAIVAIFRGK
jgi:muramidase (phage lysozyme)